MKKESFPLLIILRNIVCVILALLVMLSAPTGWLYDLWAGEGMGQGQRPGADVQRLQRQEDIETCFLSSTPSTVNGGTLVACPLARLRDVGQAGIHTHHNSGVKRSVSVSEYIYADYPLPPLQRFIQGFVGGYYNRYYLAELEDGSWLCVYFDNYLVLTGADNYPTGYVRYTTTEERRMLKQMAKDYDVDPVYILDMYRHGKVSWMLDVLVRIAVCVAAAVIVWGIKKAFSKCKLPTHGE
ncbi:MAG: hypothetical protein HFI19_15680 [Lachnospiraceae bacterium]|uniref:hypothetical protein n=1 Tax=Candidatus Merdisoma sp. JLR.KK006 TaxID=3112626 RepID=UPI00136CAD32|nr:hypothetical protein [Lachnospiraceae bacterium]NBK92151.1 hypothetical protein [bacterium 1XD21-13]